MVVLNIGLLVLSAVIPILPQILTIVPAPYNDVASGVLALAVIVYHKFTPASLTAAPIPTALPSVPPPIVVVKP
jgi:hypothetical protein